MVEWSGTTVHLTPDIVTRLPTGLLLSLKPEPEIVIRVPPATPPDEGLTPVITASNNIYYTCNYVDVHMHFTSRINHIKEQK